MTIFTTELFKLDLTHLNIKFSDENQFFEKDLIKQQSFPFRVPRERSFLSFFEFIESHNVQNPTGISKARFLEMTPIIKRN